MEKLPDYSSKRFLIADDEPFMLGLIERMLKECKATQIVKVADGATALKAIRDDLSQVDCIICDCNMKPVNGLQLLQGVRFGINPRIPRDQAFVMVTGHGDTEVVKSALMLDVNGYLVKPVALDKLVQTLERVFAKPLEAKDPEYYRALKLAKVHTLDAPLQPGQEAQKKPSAWVIMGNSAQRKDAAALRAKIKDFSVTHATRDGEAEVKIKNRRECDLAELKDGMVLAEDVFAEEGQILLRHGTTLTAGMISRLRELAVETDTRNFVWIGELAK